MKENIKNFITKYEKYIPNIEKKDDDGIKTGGNDNKGNDDRNKPTSQTSQHAKNADIVMGMCAGTIITLGILGLIIVAIIIFLFHVVNKTNKCHVSIIDASDIEDIKDIKDKQPLIDKCQVKPSYNQYNNQYNSIRKHITNDF